MGAQTQNGKAFEFAVASAFSEILGGKLISNSSLFDAKTNFSKVPAELKQRQMLAAKLGIEHLTHLANLNY